MKRIEFGHHKLWHPIPRNQSVSWFPSREDDATASYISGTKSSRLVPFLCCDEKSWGKDWFVFHFFPPLKGLHPQSTCANLCGWVRPTYWKALLTLCFWLFRNYHNRTEDKNNAGWLHGVLYMHLVVCCEGIFPQAHFTDVKYTPNVGVSLSVSWQGCGRPRTTNRHEYASTFFVCR